MTQNINNFLNVKLILCSKSLARRKILEAGEIPLKVKNCNIHEALQIGETPIGMVRRLAYCKALEGTKGETSCYSIGADTIILDNSERIIGKPTNKRDAMKILGSLSNKVHYVFTGLALIFKNNSKLIIRSGHCKTLVSFRNLNVQDIEAYISDYNVINKAGAYAIQYGGERIIQEIDGCWTNVVGLPFGLLGTLFLSGTGKTFIEVFQKNRGENPMITCWQAKKATGSCNLGFCCPFNEKSFFF